MLFDTKRDAYTYIENLQVVSRLNVCKILGGENIFPIYLSPVYTTDTPSIQYEFRVGSIKPTAYEWIIAPGHVHNYAHSYLVNLIPDNQCNSDIWYFIRLDEYIPDIHDLVPIGFLGHRSSIFTI